MLKFGNEEMGREFKMQENMMHKQTKKKKRKRGVGITLVKLNYDCKISDYRNFACIRRTFLH